MTVPATAADSAAAETADSGPTLAAAKLMRAVAVEVLVVTAAKAVTAPKLVVAWRAAVVPVPVPVVTVTAAPAAVVEVLLADTVAQAALVAAETAKQAVARNAAESGQAQGPAAAEMEAPVQRLVVWLVSIQTSQLAAPAPAALDSVVEAEPMPALPAARAELAKIPLG
jgi:hypothetical protein